MQSGQATIEFVVPACSTSTGHIISTEVEWRVLLTVGTATAHIRSSQQVDAKMGPTQPHLPGKQGGSPFLSTSPPQQARQAGRASCVALRLRFAFTFAFAFSSPQPTLVLSCTTQSSPVTARGALPSPNLLPHPPPRPRPSKSKPAIPHPLLP